MSRECVPFATTSSRNSKTDGRIYQPSPTNQIFQDRPNEEASLVRKGAQIVTSNEDMQIRVYIGSNTSTQMQTSQHLHNGDSRQKSPIKTAPILLILVKQLKIMFVKVF